MDWTRGLSHAKRALYHWATSPQQITLKDHYALHFPIGDEMKYCKKSTQICKEQNEIKTGVEMPGIERGASHMQSERSTTELHPQFIHEPYFIKIVSIYSTID